MTKTIQLASVSHSSNFNEADKDWDIINTNLQFIVKNDGIDNLNQALKFIESFRQHRFSHRQTKKLEQVKERIEQLRDALISKKHIPNRQMFINEIILILKKS